MWAFPRIPRAQLGVCVFKKVRDNSIVQHGTCLNLIDDKKKCERSTISNRVIISEAKTE